jgi:hypothetical protein
MAYLLKVFNLVLNNVRKVSVFNLLLQYKESKGISFIQKIFFVGLLIYKMAAESFQSGITVTVKHL